MGAPQTADKPCYRIQPTSYSAVDSSSQEALTALLAPAADPCDDPAAVAAAAAAVSSSGIASGTGSARDSSSGNDPPQSARHQQQLCGSNVVGGDLEPGAWQGPAVMPAVKRRGLGSSPQQQHHEQQQQQQVVLQQQCHLAGASVARPKRQQALLTAPQAQQPDVQLSDFMAVHAAVSSDGVAPVHRSVSQLRLEQQQQQQGLLSVQPPQLQLVRQVDRFAGSLQSSSCSSSPCSSSSKGERSWLKLQWQKLSGSLHKRKATDSKSRGVGQMHTGAVAASAAGWGRPSTAPGHLTDYTVSKAGSMADGDMESRRRSGGSSSSSPGRVSRSWRRSTGSAAAQHEPEQVASGSGHGSLLQACGQRGLLRGHASTGPGPGEAVALQHAAVAADLLKQQQGTLRAPACELGAESQIGKQHDIYTQQQQQQQEEAAELAHQASSSREEQQQQQRRSAFAGAVLLADLWDPDEHPHASSIAAAAAARTMGLAAVSNTAHFPHKSAPSSRSQSVDGAPQLCASHARLMPPAAMAAAAAAAAAGVWTGSCGNLQMLPLSAGGRPQGRLQPSRSSSQLSLDVAPCGMATGSNDNGGHGSSSVRHSASFTSLQVLRRQNSNLSTGGRRSSRLGGSSSARGLHGGGSSGGGGNGSNCVAVEASRLANLQQQQQGSLSCRSSYDSLGISSPAPSLAGMGLSRCGTPLSMQALSASETPQASARAAMAGLPPGPFVHDAPVHHPADAMAGGVGCVGANDPAWLQHQQQHALDAMTPGVGCGTSSRMQAAFLPSLNTWANTPMAAEQLSASCCGSPGLCSPLSRPSSPAGMPDSMIPRGGSSSGGCSMVQLAAAARQWQPSTTPHLQRCMSASGALTRSTSCGSSLAAAAAAARAAALPTTRICSLPGVVSTHAALAAGGHLVHTMSGNLGAALAAAAAAGGVEEGEAAAVAPQLALGAALGPEAFMPLGVGVNDWLALPRAPEHLMWRQPQGKMRPLPGHRTHYHSDSAIQAVQWPAAAASPNPAAAAAAAVQPPAAVAAAAAAAGSAAGLQQPVGVAAAVDEVLVRASTPGVDGVLVSGGGAIAPGPSMEASLLALQTKTIKCSMCGVSGLGAGVWAVVMVVGWFWVDLWVGWDTCKQATSMLCHYLS